MTNEIDQDMMGVQLGVDFGSESVSDDGDNQAWLFGVMGGWAESDVRFANTSS